MKNLLETYFSKKNLRLISMAMGVAALIFYFVVKSITSSIASGGSLGLFTFVFIVFYVFIALTSVIAIYYAYRIYFKNQDKDISVAITFGVCCWTILILLLNIQTLVFFIKVANASSIWDLAGLASSAANVETFAQLLDLTLWVLVILAGYNGYMFNKTKGMVEETVQPTATSTEANTTAGASASTTSTTPDLDKKPNETVEKIKGFVSTKKGKGIIAGVLVACLVIVVALNVLGNRKTEIDLTKAVEVTFEGVSGDGYAYISNDEIEYDGNDDDVEEFIDTVYFTLSKTSGLKNGDEITLKAKYSSSAAEEYKINPTNDKITVTVEGLEIEFESYDDLSKDEKKKVETAWTEYFEEGSNFDEEVRDELEYDFKRDSTIALSDKQVIGRYYGDSDYSGDDVIVYVVKVTASGTERYDDKEKKMTKYYHIALPEVTPKTIEKVKKSKFELTYSSEITDVENDEEALEETVDYYEGRYNDYTMTKLK
ncbi:MULTISPECIES: hypothetical protein [unclassified Breznakia]|uniref:hypothetical protein n=1 Tax=unclassified Breznakia TaxID=2623764 RepID=UPI0024754ACF|nr:MULTISPECIES: hypothetical protein [unclassified Breznakia]MDH6366537.1 hypothetical protein [Breznakia sp. PH1-1]MDH6403630.1 hypothetical protein [Breznakia sp. PF1-11]MDH6411339.1 hypothetical protein [Breznakia sp. PFB1-11]MDH6413685.1 hypothetical protein [Breznakia sp. PFB1-14]MDH6415884.1 hypothetical protein [Breznakia sp. PFB1-4]